MIIFGNFSVAETRLTVHSLNRVKLKTEYFLSRNQFQLSELTTFFSFLFALHRTLYRFRLLDLAVESSDSAYHNIFVTTRICVTNLSIGVIPLHL